MHVWPLQVFGCTSRKRKLPPDRTVALWSHLHRLPRPAANEAAHGPFFEEAQVSLSFFSFLVYFLSKVLSSFCSLSSKGFFCLLCSFLANSNCLSVLAHLLAPVQTPLCISRIFPFLFGLFKQWSMTQVLAPRILMSLHRSLSHKLFQCISESFICLKWMYCCAHECFIFTVMNWQLEWTSVFCCDK